MTTNWPTAHPEAIANDLPFEVYPPAGVSTFDEISEPLLDPQETSSPFQPKGTYRQQFMNGKEIEYEATIEALLKICTSPSGSKIHALRNCRSFAHFARDKVSGDVRVMTDSCRQRWCPMCAGQKSKFAKEATETYVRTLKAPRFLTLTLRNNENGLKPQIEFLQDCFRRLRQRAYWKKNVTGGIWFLQIKRAKNSGCWHPHFHILLDGNYMEQSELSALWDLVTFGSPIIDIRQIHSPEESSGYVARYSARPANLAEMSIDDRIEIMEALHGKRLCGTFGNAKSVTLTPPKIEDGSEWERLGYYDNIIRDAETNKVAMAVLNSWKMSVPLPEWAYQAILDSKVKVVYIPTPKAVISQLTMDFYNSS